MKNQSASIEIFFQNQHESIYSLLREQVHPEFLYHDLRHTKDVMKQAESIADHMGVDDYSKMLLRVAALYHDTGFSVSRTEHEEEGVKIFCRDAAAFGLLASEVEIISALIRATKLPQRPQTMLEQIICDADLDYLGRSDFPEISSLLYLELKTSGVVQSRNEWYKLQCEFLDKHAFHTSFSQTKHASGLNENRAFAKSLLDKYS